jgi:hypothetical protein
MTSFTLVRNTRKVPIKEVERVAKALERQLHRDVCPAWGEAPDVALQVLDAPDENFFGAGVQSALTTWPEGTGLESPPLILCDGEMPTFGGYHTRTDARVPYAAVFVGARWSLRASHELIEMFLNPKCNTYHKGPMPGSSDDTAEYLREVCGPCQHRAFAYAVDGVEVSDFVFPAWFGLEGAQAKRFDHRRKISAPFELLLGGYATWRDRARNSFQIWRTKQGITVTPVDG